MTTTSDQTAPPIEPPDLAPPVADQPDNDRRPGTSDIAWAERAYRHQPAGPARGPRRARPTRRLRPRTLVAAPVVVLLAAGLALAMGDQSPAPAPVGHRPALSQRVTAGPATTRQPHPTLRPPLLRPFPSIFPAPARQKR